MTFEPDSPGGPTRPMWTVAEAIEFICDINGLAVECGYNPHLGGGLVTRPGGVSYHDADILFMPRYQALVANRTHVLLHLRDLGWKEGKISHQRLPFRDVVTVEKDGKVVDLIFVVFP